MSCHTGHHAGVWCTSLVTEMGLRVPKYIELMSGKSDSTGAAEGNVPFKLCVSQGPSNSFQIQFLVNMGLFFFTL